MPLPSGAAAEKEARANKKRLRTGWRTGCSEESKTSALKLALSRLPRRNRRTFLDNAGLSYPPSMPGHAKDSTSILQIQEGRSGPSATAAHLPPSTTCTGNAIANTTIAGEPTRLASGSHSKRARSPDSLAATPRKKMRKGDGSETIASSNAESEKSIPGEDNCEAWVCPESNERQGSSALQPQIEGEERGRYCEEDKSSTRFETAENNGGITSMGSSTLSIEELWDDMSRDDSLS